MTHTADQLEGFTDLRRKMDILLRFFWVATAIPAIAVAVIAILKFMGKL